jgi:hypothetical protein
VDSAAGQKAATYVIEFLGGGATKTGGRFSPASYKCNKKKLAINIS